MLAQLEGKYFLATHAKLKLVKRKIFFLRRILKNKTDVSDGKVAAVSKVSVSPNKSFEGKSKPTSLFNRADIHLRVKSIMGDKMTESTNSVKQDESIDGMSLLGNMFDILATQCDEHCQQLLLNLLEAALNPFFCGLSDWVFGGVPDPLLVRVDSSALSARDGSYLIQAFTSMPDKIGFLPLFGDILHKATEAGTMVNFLRLCAPDHPLLNSAEISRPFMGFFTNARTMRESGKRCADYNAQARKMLDMRKVGLPVFEDGLKLQAEIRLAKERRKKNELKRQQDNIAARERKGLQQRQQVTCLTKYELFKLCS